MRARPVRLLPQRPLHRARDQGAARLRLRALDGRGRLRGQARPGARAGRDADGADHDPGQGVGPDRAHRRRARTSPPSACWSPAPARSGCWRRCSACSAGSRCTCSTATPTGRSRSSSAALGGHYHHSDVATVADAAPPDITIEATGAEQVVAEAMAHNARVRHRLPDRRLAQRARRSTIDLGGLNRDIVLENDVVFGTVNANLDHYPLAAEALGARRPRLARADDHPPRAARGLRAGVREAARRRQGRPRPLTPSPPWRRGRAR